MPQLGSTQLDIVPLCLGGNVFGWTADWDASYAVLDEFAGLGGNFIDTADAYSAWVPGNLGGESETILGGWMHSRGCRDRMVIATKVGRHPLRANLTRDTIRACVAGCLRRLRTDRIDLLYAHSDDPETPLEETLAALGELIAEGTVRYVAASNYSAPRLAEALRVADTLGVPRFSALQPHYSLVNRGDYEGELEGPCASEGIPCLPYYSLASGFLTGKYADAAAASAAPRNARLAQSFTERGLRTLDAVRRVAGECSTAPATVALAWLLAKPTVAAPIASASRPEQVRPLMDAVTLRLSADQVARLDEASS